jgi:GPI inositol-deacylase
VLLFYTCLTVAALSRLLHPMPDGCVMTYMYSTYIPISAMPGNICCFVLIY